MSCIFFFRRKDCSALLSAALLAKEAGEPERARVLAKQTVNRLRTEEDTEERDRVAHRMATEFPKMREEVEAARKRQEEGSKKDLESREQEKSEESRLAGEREL